MNLITRLIALVLLAAGIIVFPVCAEVKAPTDPVIIDVREEHEWKAGHLEGAILIPHERIGDELPKIISDRQTKIYLYCRSGRRTGIAYETLRKAGYGNLVNLETVEKASKAMNRPVVK